MEVDLPEPEVNVGKEGRDITEMVSGSSARAEGKLELPDDAQATTVEGTGGAQERGDVKGGEEEEEEGSSSMALDEREGEEGERVGEGDVDTGEERNEIVEDSEVEGEGGGVSVGLREVRQSSEVDPAVADQGKSGRGDDGGGSVGAMEAALEMGGGEGDVEVGVSGEEEGGEWREEKGELSLEPNEEGEVGVSEEGEGEMGTREEGRWSRGEDAGEGEMEGEKGTREEEEEELLTSPRGGEGSASEGSPGLLKAAFERPGSSSPLAPASGPSFGVKRKSEQAAFSEGDTATGEGLKRRREALPLPKAAAVTARGGGPFRSANARRLVPGAGK